MTYYEILEVQPTASPEVIRMAYKALIRKYHPDVYSGDAAIANEMTKLINEAYEVLSDPQKKEMYDRFLSMSGKADQGKESQQEPPEKSSHIEPNPKKEPSVRRPLTILAIVTLLVLILVIWLMSKYDFSGNTESTYETQSYYNEQGVRYVDSKDSPGDYHIDENYVEGLYINGSARLYGLSYCYSDCELSAYYRDKEEIMVFLDVKPGIWSICKNGRNTDYFFKNGIFGKYKSEWRSPEDCKEPTIWYTQETEPETESPTATEKPGEDFESRLRRFNMVEAARRKNADKPSPRPEGREETPLTKAKEKTITEQTMSEEQRANADKILQQAIEKYMRLKNNPPKPLGRDETPLAWAKEKAKQENNNR